MMVAIKNAPANLALCENFIEALRRMFEERSNILIQGHAKEVSIALYFALFMKLKSHSTLNIQRPTSKCSWRLPLDVESWALNVECFGVK
jgi:hypothetical protein